MKAKTIEIVISAVEGENNIELIMKRGGQAMLWNEFTPSERTLIMTSLQATGDLFVKFEEKNTKQ